jgi:hypothetical protein
MTQPNLPTKQDLLSQIRELSKAKLIARGEVLKAYDEGQGGASSDLPHKGLNLNYARILGFIGGLIVFLGVIFLVSLFWGDMSDVVQVLVTLGSGVVAYLTGSLLMQALDQKFVGASVHLIGGLLMPIGIIVWMTKIFPSPVDGRPVILAFLGAFGLLFGLYVLTDYFLKHNVFTLFAALFGSIAYWLAFAWVIFDQEFLLSEWRLFFWAWLVIGVVYCAFGEYFQSTKRAIVGQLLYIVGIFSILNSVFGLVYDRGILESSFVLVLSGCFYLSTQLKSRGFLIFGLIYLIGYIFYINGRYFADVIGWPIALIICGLMLILVSYFGVVWNRRFIQAKA